MTPTDSTTTSALRRQFPEADAGLDSIVRDILISAG
jgi:hypothetical protein